MEIVGNLLSMDNSVNFKGASIDVTPLEDGPSLILAKVVPENELETGKAATPLPWGGGSGCPEGTVQVVRVTWAGGVTKPGGDDIDEKERVQYKVTVMQEDSSLVEVTPFAVADLGDGDNNHRLCLDVAGTPQSVYFPEGYMTDPREDLNPETSIVIQK